MPEWIHNRAEHLLAKNPSMPKSMAFAVATQQSHSLGKSPKGFGTAEGKRTAKAKFDTPKDDQKKANPGSLKSDKLAGVTSTHRVVVDTTRDGADALKALLENIEQLGAPGHSFSILSDDKVNLGGWDGDGYMHMQRIAVEPLKEKQASLATDLLAPLPAFVREKLAFAAPTALKGLTSTLAGAAHSLPQTLKAAPAAAKNVLTGATPHFEHVNELAGLGVLALPGMDTLQSRLRARAAGDKSEHGAESRRLLGEGAHAALDVAGLGMLAAPAASRLMKHGFSPSAYGGNTAQNPPGMKGRSLVPPFKAPELEQKEAGIGVGAGMSTSQYSGPLSYGPFKMTSGIPPFRSPEMAKQDQTGDPALWAVGGNKQAAATGALSPAGRLSVTQQVGAPKTTGFTGPSIADVSKPKGFGTPISGAQKNQL